MIFLDNASTTRVFDNALACASNFAQNNFYNPSALYGGAADVRRAVSDARSIIAARLDCPPENVYFTSCATESNNWALTYALKNKKSNVVISAGEHASNYETAVILKSKGVDVRFAKLLPNGKVDEDDLLSKVDENTSFVSVIHVSNETGVKNDIQKLAVSIKKKNAKIIFHSDGVQALGKCDNSVRRLGVDMYSVSGHKVGALKGIGCLYIKKGINLSPLIFGGGQENRLRSGTENVPGIISFASALNEFAQTYDAQKMLAFRKIVLDHLLPLGNITENGIGESILSMSVDGIKAEILSSICYDDGLVIGLGSACSAKKQGNRVLSEMGLSKNLIEGNIRISFGVNTTADEVNIAAKILKKNIVELRGRMNG